MATRVELDARGLKCPLPVLRARKAMQPLAEGDVLVVLATDPGAAADLRAFCDTTGHRWIGAREEGGVTAVEIAKMA
ncbi:MAG: sulfurtransferase TusA family protein [Alphaproteobacteria bacterium]|nr:sulfurtransferase TusA family protein [Alphaproteobacteria bacterium]